MSSFFNGQANKAIVAILTAVAASLPIYFSDATWLPIVISALGAITTWLVPNSPPPAGQGKEPPARM